MNQICKFLTQYGAGFERPILPKYREGIMMDFIEQSFHIAPDNGNGALELLYITFLLMVTVFLASQRKLLLKLLKRYLNK